MSTWLKSLLVILLLVAVATVFISPAIDLEPTALRASRAAQALQIALLSAALAIRGLLSPIFVSLTPQAESRGVNHENLLDLNCTRLC